MTQILTIEHSSLCAGMPVLVSITNAMGRSDYWAEPIPADFGLGLRFRKIWERNDFAVGAYHVNLDAGSGDHTCDCPAGQFRGKCRHIAAAVQLFDAGIFCKVRPEEAAEVPGKVAP